MVIQITCAKLIFPLPYSSYGCAAEGPLIETSRAWRYAASAASASSTEQTGACRSRPAEPQSQADAVSVPGLDMSSPPLQSSYAALN